MAKRRKQLRVDPRVARAATRKIKRQKRARAKLAKFGASGAPAPVVVRLVGSEDGEVRRIGQPVTDYERYLTSKKWRSLRLKVLARDRNKCVQCGAKRGLHVHHMTYERIYQERLDDLVTLCSGCHRAVHRLEAAA